jgi:murein DD-endopeptidase MepM/ murein hydrolase activator NlpD
MHGVNTNHDGSPKLRLEPHDGVDIALSNVGDVVIASADGIVDSVAELAGYGTRVVIHHNRLPAEVGPAYLTVYVHLRSSSVRQGDHIKRGDEVGRVGLFLHSGGVVHVHWMLCHGRCEQKADKPNTRDPLSRSAGCFRRGKAYPPDRLVLTYPVRC